MKNQLSRRRFVKDAALASAAVVAAARGVRGAEPVSATATATVTITPKDSVPMGKIGKQEFSRLMLGGNLVNGFAHARDLKYVGQLMKRYNTEAKILETLEIAEAHGVNAISSSIQDSLTVLRKHWQHGGKMKLIVQANIEGEDSLVQFQKAIDLGASAVQMQGHSSEKVLERGRIELIGKAVQLVKKQGVVAGVAAHALSVIEECENAGINPDFYQKTLHTQNYPSALRPDEHDDTGKWDNSWCRDPEEVIKFMAGVKKPWIAFKVMAAGAIHPKQAFPYAFNNGADFVLAGMFDWQVAEDVQIAKRALGNLKRTRPWFS